MAPPTLIQATRGPRPENSARGPSSRSRVVSTWRTELWSVLLASMTRVLRTSRGVVRPAAAPPETEPYRALSSAPISGDDDEDAAVGLLSARRRSRARAFRNSHRGNWMT